MKKIALILELAGTERHGGEQQAMLNVTNEIKKMNYPISLFSYISKNPQYKIKSLIPLKLRLLPFIRDIFFVPIIGLRIMKKIERDYDILLTSSTTIASLHKPKSKIIITCHIIRSQKFETLSKIKKYKIFFNPLSYLITSTLEKR